MYSREKSLIGVPAGSVLAVIIFTLYINDLPNSVPSDCKVIFADDSNFLVVDKAEEVDKLRICIKSGMGAICRYLTDNELTQNVDKTKMLTFCLPKVFQRIRNFAFTINDCIITNSEFLKCLGLYLDPLLRFDYHIDKMVTSCFLRLKSLYPIRHLLSKENLKLIGHALILSLVQYMSAVWGASNAKIVKRVEKVVRSLARLILGLRKYDKVADAIATDLKCFFPKKLCLYRSMLIFYKIYKLNCIPFFDGVFIRNSEIHAHSTRQAYQARCNILVKNYADSQSFCDRTLSCWNGLPDNIRNTDSVTIFKKL